MASASAILASRILIVDDQHSNTLVLQTMLQRAGYLHTTSTTDPTSVCSLHGESNYDLILLDIQMPEMDGFQVMEALGRSHPENYPSILIITAQPRHKLRAAEAGAKDFISKPFDHSEVLTRIHYMLEVRLLNGEVDSHSKFLEETVRARTAELSRSEEIFRELATGIPEALCIKNLEEQTIEYVNPAWHNLNGLRAIPGDPIDKSCEAIHPDDREWALHDRRGSADNAASTEYRILRPDSSVRWVHARAFPIANPSGHNPLVVEIIEDVTQKREADQKLVYLARHDALTGLPNRAFVYASLHEALEHASIHNLMVSVLLLDIDCFKQVNDTMGHATGDALLRDFAARLSGCMRPKDVVGRLGGDEFAIIISTPVTASGAPIVANRIRKALKAPFVLKGRDVIVTMSIGIASYPQDATDSDTLMCFADIALYDAKAAGRHTFRCYIPEMNSRSLMKAEMKEALHAALEGQQFCLHYQPKVQAGTGSLTGVEALLRWNRPDHGPVSPNAFIPALEEFGLIAPVGAWVINAACKQIREWQMAALGSVRVAVNVSPHQIREEQFVAQVSEALRTHKIDPALLEFEITESTLMAHGESTDGAVRKLKALGISISIDDFGTGYSNLAYLKRFRVDALKIDIALIRNVTADPDAATIAVAIINMAHDLQLKIVAEGVETREQFDFLRLHDCDEIQGYLVCRPIPADELSAMLRAACERKAEKRLTLPNGPFVGGHADETDKLPLIVAQDVARGMLEDQLEGRQIRLAGTRHLAVTSQSPAT